MRAPLSLASLFSAIGSSAFAQELGWLDSEALNLGRAIMGAAVAAAWFWALIKASDAGHKILAWTIGLAPIVILILGFAGAFR